ncbi:hypothetical protein FSP39_016375 [Pinctada imbricata]|uniref:Fibronectin type-III domain-containing protein n=1 Tax=Pinctada imbricata TaxID=66713 RepID=A0AA89CCT0_PINIB|nr:hypothetical protein FSP39_016375 [Pinctada imbricata]
MRTLLLIHFPLLFHVHVCFPTENSLADCATKVTECPSTQEAWERRSAEVNCSQPATSYACLFDRNKDVIEVCIVPYRVQPGIAGCPYIISCDDRAPIPVYRKSYFSCEGAEEECPGDDHNGYTFHQLYKYTPLSPQGPLVASEITDRSMKLEWGQMSNEEDDITKKYIIEYIDGHSIKNGIETLESQTSFCDLDSLTENTVYIVQVRAVNTWGISDPLILKVKTKGPPAVPQGPLIASDITDSSVQLTWNACKQYEEDVQESIIEYINGHSGEKRVISIDGSRNSCHLHGLSESTVYILRIRAINRWGTSGPLSSYTKTKDKKQDPKKTTKDHLKKNGYATGSISALHPSCIQGDHVQQYVDNIHILSTTDLYSIQVSFELFMSECSIVQIVHSRDTGNANCRQTSHENGELCTASFYNHEGINWNDVKCAVGKPIGQRINFLLLLGATIQDYLKRRGIKTNEDDSMEDFVTETCTQTLKPEERNQKTYRSAPRRFRVDKHLIWNQTVVGV